MTCTHQNVIRVIKSRKMRWVRHVACMGAMRNAYIILVGNPERRRPLGRRKRRWENNIQDSDQWRVLVNTVMNFQVP
jgi:hypothetical protein